MKKYSYSFNEEYYQGEFDTPEEAAEEAFADKDDCNTVWVGENRKYTADDFVNAETIIDNVICMAGDEAGEYCDDWLCDLILDKEKLRELEKIVSDWIQSKYPPTFWTVDNVEKIERAAGHDANP